MLPDTLRISWLLAYNDQRQAGASEEQAAAHAWRVVALVQRQVEPQVDTDPLLTSLHDKDEPMATLRTLKRALGLDEAASLDAMRERFDQHLMELDEAELGGRDPGALLTELAEALAAERHVDFLAGLELAKAQRPDLPEAVARRWARPRA
jgi:hypothetical protein